MKLKSNLIQKLYQFKKITFRVTAKKKKSLPISCRYRLRKTAPSSFFYTFLQARYVLYCKSYMRQTMLTERTGFLSTVFIGG